MGVDISGPRSLPRVDISDPQGPVLRGVGMGGVRIGGGVTYPGKEEVPTPCTVCCLDYRTLFQCFLKIIGRILKLRI